MVEHYGKSSLPLLIQKKSFFNENDKHLKRQKEIALIYASQPRRVKCKNCDKKLNSSSDFTKDGIEYIICDQCFHLNGIYEDTDEFCNAVYISDSGEKYAENYSSENLDKYNYRVASIYLPKAEFLHTSLMENNIDAYKLEYFDFGAGSGYFVSALKKMGVSKVTGSDVSKAQVNFGNSMIGEKLLNNHRIEDTYSILKETKAQVVSLIGVLEHLQEPRKALEYLQANENVKYLYMLLPMFSLSVYLEVFSADFFHRQLHGGHTHLYTEKSIRYICKEFRFDIVGEWWFGTDVVDLYRHFCIKFETINCSKKLRELWKTNFLPIIDAIQLEIDKKKFSSQVHLVIKK